MFSCSIVMRILVLIIIIIIIIIIVVSKDALECPWATVVVEKMYRS